MIYLILVIAGFGLANIIVLEDITIKLRSYILYRIPLIREIVSCRRCASVWCGYLITSIYFGFDHWKESLVVAFASHALVVLSEEHEPHEPIN